MGMLERSAKQRAVINTIVWAVTLSVLILAGLLIWRTTRLGNIDGAVGEQFGLGPIELFELQKQPVGDGGYQAIIGFLPGLFVYFLTWAVVALLIALLRLRKIKM